MKPMETLLTAATLVLWLVSMWAGSRRLRFGSFATTLLSIVEVVGVVIAVVALGWLGVALLVAINVIAALIWSIVWAARKESLLAAGAAESGIDVEELDGLWKWMRHEKAFATMPPLERARLIKLLCMRARTPDEIREMSIPIAHLEVIFELELDYLVERFDLLLRRAGKSAAEAMEVADVLTRGTQLSAASFDEMLDALVAFYDDGTGDVALELEEPEVGSAT
jgi:hypothetical protein